MKDIFAKLKNNELLIDNELLSATQVFEKFADVLAVGEPRKVNPTSVLNLESVEDVSTPVSSKLSSLRPRTGRKPRKGKQHQDTPIKNFLISRPQAKTKEG